MYCPMASCKSCMKEKHWVVPWQNKFDEKCRKNYKPIACELCVGYIEKALSRKNDIYSELGDNPFAIKSVKKFGARP